MGVWVGWAAEVLVGMGSLEHAKGYFGLRSCDTYGQALWAGAFDDMMDESPLF